MSNTEQLGTPNELEQALAVLRAHDYVYEPVAAYRKRENARAASQTSTLNGRGEWVPAIPLPLYVGPLMSRKRCDCGETFWTTDAYRGHFALVHILGASA